MREREGERDLEREGEREREPRELDRDLLRELERAGAAAFWRALREEERKGVQRGGLSGVPVARRGRT